MKIALLIVGSLVGLLVLAGLVLYLLGRSLPERHTSRLTIVLPAARPVVWAVITDYASAKHCADTDRYARFFAAMLESGYYFAPSQFEAAFLSTAHSPADLDGAINAFSRTLAAL